MSTARTHRINIRLSQQELEKALRYYANSTCRSLSEYARKLLLQQPIKVFFRNDPFQEIRDRLLPFIEEAEKTVGEIASLDPQFLDAYAQLLEYTEDIRVALAKLNDQCDPK
jgi:hypothetical protein